MKLNKRWLLSVKACGQDRTKSFDHEPTEQDVDAIAAAQFEYVGDEGLFPNHTNKDIWIAGFVAAYFHFNKEPARFQLTIKCVNGKYSIGKTKRLK